MRCILSVLAPGTAPPSAGNSGALPDDFPGMTCSQTRTALSAALDGEDPGVPAGSAEAHLAGCPACRAWQAGAREVSAAVRSEVPEDAPDLTTPVLAAVVGDWRARAARAARADRRRSALRTPPGAVDRSALATRGGRSVLRVALAVTALAQLLSALPVLLGVGALDAATHLGRERASFDLALAVGVLLAARRPERAGAFLPVLAVLAVSLGLTSVLDVARGAAVAAQEAAHLVAVLQAGLLWVLGRPPAPASAATAGPVRAAA